MLWGPVVYMHLTIEGYGRTDRRRTETDEILSDRQTDTPRY